MATPMKMHGGGYAPSNSSSPYQNPQSHGGDYAPGQHTHEPQNASALPAQQFYSSPPQNPIYQSQVISSVESPYKVEPDVMKSNPGAYTSAVDIDEYNDTSNRRRPVHLTGTMHYFHPETRYRFKYPHLYQLPAYQYESTQIYRHRDAMSRVSKNLIDDRYLSPWDGHLAKLHVQATDEIYVKAGTSTWRRTYVRPVAPFNVRIATWPIDFSVDVDSWKDWGFVLLKFIPASFALVFFVFSSDGPDQKYGLRYAPLPYKFHGYAKAARNLLENSPMNGSRKVVVDPLNQVSERLLLPRHLCFLNDPDAKELKGWNPISVDHWKASKKTKGSLRYLFVAYSAEQFSHTSNDDLDALHVIAETAARQAGLPAYWVACSCMPNRDEVEEDVYRISDIMRGADAMVIAVGRSSKEAPMNSTGDMLRHWGSRMWTFPEVLLSPSKEIKVYTRGSDLANPLIMPKKKFAAEVWADAQVARQLIDHYAGSLGLSRLELVTLALTCLTTRGTTQYLLGDHSYALMGLLRLRPKVDHTDTAFQAFSRLSLMNDSDLLLERLICTLPRDANQPWYVMDDAYGSQLWDIYPTCQVAGVGDDDTVIIDGAYGTSIRWKAFHPIWTLRKWGWRRWFAWKLLHASSTFVLISFILMGIGSQAQNSGTIGAGVILLFLGIAGWLMAPRLLQIILGGKFWNTQAAVFGFEGYLSLPTIERAIFGGNFGRLEWSTNGSPLSRHYKNEAGECVGVDPTDDIETRNLVELATDAQPGQQRVFTIVDTYTMEVTLIQAARPPIALIICGSEGGMQRAIGCSYDWTTGTLYRETVMRMKTTVLDRMDRVEKLKFGLTRPDVPVRHRLGSQE
ncbi:3-hydroxyisobutyrate dehydrogenase protein [Phlyctema vagabunda]|uniref:3-hydroxyisobutyrate dehydrogenase protein n=1 Tax=Phlyctema vagabunda TaxID=108571 RepID=A0ABR4PHV8_9HELO